MAKSTGPIRAAGVVLLREDSGQPLVCVAPTAPERLVTSQRQTRPGENEIIAARRETIEETGAAMSCSGAA